MEEYEMRSAKSIRDIAESSLLSYVYFNPLFRATRSVRKKIRRYMNGKSRLTLNRAAA